MEEHGLDAATFDETDWKQIVALYDHLASFVPTPIVELNRAIALNEAIGPEPALEVLPGEARAPGDPLRNRRGIDL